jgi:hypothetical protein
MNKIADVENVICSAETKAEHPELYHYTNPTAFDGIAKSHSLWCSHFRDMVDKAEVTLMRALLSKEVAPRINAIVEENYNRHVRRIWKKSGGGERTARDLVNAFYGVTFDCTATYSAMEAFLFSFSSHAGDTEFDRVHGVQSQWESYAGPEGYCLVFDIGAVAEMLKQEGNLRYWAWLILEPIRYADQPVGEIFPELVHGLADMLPRRQVRNSKHVEETLFPCRQAKL